MTTKLEKLKVQEVSLVDAPAIGVGVVLTKAADAVVVPASMCEAAKAAAGFVEKGCKFAKADSAISAQIASGQIDKSSLPVVKAFFDGASSLTKSMGEDGTPNQDMIDYMAMGGCEDGSAESWCNTVTTEKANDDLKTSILAAVEGAVTAALAKANESHKANEAAITKAFEIHAALMAEKIDAAKKTIDILAETAKTKDSDEWWNAFYSLDALNFAIRDLAAVVGVDIPAEPMEKAATPLTAASLLALVGKVTKSVEVVKAAATSSAEKAAEVQKALDKHLDAPVSKSLAGGEGQPVAKNENLWAGLPLSLTR